MPEPLSWVADKQPMERAGDLIDAPCPDCDGSGENEDPYCGEPNCECRSTDQTCPTCDGEGTVPAVLDENPGQDEVRISHMENGEWVRTVPVTTIWACTATPWEEP